MNALSQAALPLASFDGDPSALAMQCKSGGKSLDQVARSFESMFVSLILKEMRQTLEPGSFFGKDGGDVHGGLFDMYLGQHLAGAGGFGVAAMIKRQLQHSGPK